MQGHSLAPHDDPSLLPVSLTVSIVAVLIALVSLIAHRAHTRTIYTQNETITQWVYYASKATGRTSYDAMLDFLPGAPLKDPASAAKLEQTYRQKIEHIDAEQEKIGARAEALENTVTRQENAADRFDLGDVWLEAALVIVSITLLTKRRLYWWIGLTFASVGILIASTGFFVV
ncbi:MAG TPA: DUF4337 domain-containing protein [Bryobacteraceae bacterium]|jgi:hypothetical protein|nr:DUF4337 domain-containing protein [Bryobacteraceae bacterium]